MNMVQTPNLSESLPVAPPHGKVTWTEEADDILREEWSKATPARAIATMLTAHLGSLVTRNSVLGRAHRVGLDKHENAHNGRPRRAKATNPDLIRPTGCRWIDGDACGWQSKWCDAPVADPTESWCAHHRSIVFRPKTMAEIEAAAGVHKNKRAA